MFSSPKIRSQVLSEPMMTFLSASQVLSPPCTTILTGETGKTRGARAGYFISFKPVMALVKTKMVRF